YLFVYPIPRFFDGFPNISYLHSERNLYYFSFDPDGRTTMTERERVMGGLPRLIPEASTWMTWWRPVDYDFMRELQEVKGFDSTTTEFASSAGLPILQIVREDN
ncbi:hypothetical protein L218DRAFT_828225, partial [Marasmius fiardii PR-910]